MNFMKMKEKTPENMFEDLWCISAICKFYDNYAVDSSGSLSKIDLNRE